MAILKVLLRFLLLAAAQAALAIQALAMQTPDIVYFTDQNTWEKASGDVNTFDFAGLGGSNGRIDEDYGKGLRISGIEFRGSGYGTASPYLLVRSEGSNFLFGPPDSDLGCPPPPPNVPCGRPGGGITVSLPAGVTSVGFDLGTYWPPAGAIAITFPNGQTFRVPDAPILSDFRKTHTFAGFTSTTPIHSLVIHAAGMPIVRSFALNGGITPPISGRPQQREEALAPAAQPDRRTERVDAPRVLSKVDPQYTQEARRAKLVGTVLLSLVVGIDGKVADVKVLRGLGMGLDEKAMEAIKQWIFKPGMRDGSPVSTRAQVEMNFRCGECR